jgi:penicillin-binding protein 1A
VALDANDGAVLALVGGFDFSQSKFNRVTQAYRQPGSAFKPFIYSAALGAGYTAASVINDAPLVFYEPGLASVWRPENYTHTYLGPIDRLEAYEPGLEIEITNSRNLVSIRLLQELGVDKALRHVAHFGFDVSRLPRNLSLALGTGAITPMDLTTGYTTIANGGFRVEPHFIETIESASGQVLMQSASPNVCHDCEDVDEAAVASPVAVSTAVAGTPDVANTSRHAPRTLDPQNAWVINSMLRDVIREGTAKAAKVLNRGDIAGKTGTTNEQKDAWFSGFNSRIVATAWVGFDQSRPLGKDETGARAALPMWIKFMRTALEGSPESIMPEPPGLVKVRIDPDSGLLSDASNPRAIFEVFPADTAPVEHAPYIEFSHEEPQRPADVEADADVPEQLF